MSNDIITNKIWVGGIPIWFGKPFEIRLHRGLVPWKFSFTAIPKTAGRFEKLKKGEVIVMVETPDDDSRRRARIRLKKWHVISVRPKTDGLFEVEVADHKWFLNNQKVTALYNVRALGGGHRPDSLDNGKLWTCWRAVKNVIEVHLKGKMRIKNFPADLKSVILPDDLGDYFGGWHAAPMKRILSAFLEPIRSDIVTLKSGTMNLVARKSKRGKETDRFIDGLKKWSTAGIAGVADVHLQVPQAVIFQFPVRRERRFEVDEDSRTGVVNRLNPVIENVCPVYDEQNPNAGAGEFQLWDDYVLENLFILGSQVLSRFTSPTMVDTSKLSPRAAFNIYVHEDLVRQSWRKIYRVKDSGAGREARYKYADMTFGRLQLDGTTRDAPVYADYIRVLRFGERRPKTKSYWAARFSQNVEFDGHVPAPFTVAWLPSLDELVFQLSPSALVSKFRHYHLGLFEKDMSFGNPADILSGKRPMGFETNEVFRRRFKMFVYWHGAELGAKFDIKRTVTTVKTGDHTLEFPVYDEYANFQFQTQGKEPTNLDRCLRRAQELLDFLVESYKVKRAGIVECAGVGSIKAGFETRGEIFDTIIQVGGTREWEIKTIYPIVPEARPPQPRPLRREVKDNL